MEKLILKKLALLNKISWQVIVDENNTSIIKKFTEKGMEVLGADFAFAWEKSLDDKEYIFFDSDVIKGNYEPEISPNVRSYMLISIRYGERRYGRIALCYKQKHVFIEEELMLAETIGNMISRAVTINWVIEKEQNALALAEKQ